MRRYLPVAASLFLLALAACRGSSADSDAKPTSARDGPAAATATAPSATEDRFSPVVLSYSGVNNLIEGEIIISEGFEFVLGATRENLELIEQATVHMPDGRDIVLNPSTDLGVPLDFFNYYGTSEGLPPGGVYTFELTMKDGTTIEVENQFDGRVLSLPENVRVETDRAAGFIDVTWDPVEGVRNYTVDVQDIQPDGSYVFVGAGCPDPNDVDPDRLDASYLTEPRCRIEGLKELLERGRRYGIQITVWSDFSYGGIDGALVFVW